MAGKKQKRSKNRKSTTESDSTYLLKLVMYLIVGSQWLRVESFPDWSVPIPFGLIIGLLIFGALFAINSSVHSFLIVDYAKADGVSLDVGFYYMANAMGRLIGTVLSGWLYQKWGLESCLIGSALFLFAATAISLYLPRTPVAIKAHS